LFCRESHGRAADLEKQVGATLVAGAAITPEPTCGTSITPGRGQRVRSLRVYVDSSVLGGCRDAEFEQDSARLIEWARCQELMLLISEICLLEIFGKNEQTNLSKVERNALAKVVVEIKKQLEG
jgi:hypothetical protein